MSLAGAILISVLVASSSGARGRQEDAANLVRLFRLTGTFGEGLPAAIKSEGTSDGKSRNPGFTLTSAKLESDGFGFRSRLRSTVTIANTGSQRITTVEWRLDVYDESLRSPSATVLQGEKINIYPGETVTASAKFGAVLPDKTIILLQLVGVSFADGSSWSATEECSLQEDLRTVSCTSK